MCLFALAITGYALTMLGAPHLRTPFIQALFGSVPIAVILHLAGGATALATGAFQFNTALRNRRLNLHRWLGRCYVIAVLIGGGAAFALALRSTGGIPTHFGFGLLAVLWIGSTLNAYRHIRARHVVQHRQWMIRSYALTLAAVTLRIYLPLSLAAGLPFEPVYITVSWLCWVPNLVFAEWWWVPRSVTQPTGTLSS
jgi:uncharacterized membrane protein